MMPIPGRWETGVYCWFNTVTGKRYVGSASISFENRLRYYRNDFKKGKCHNIHLGRAWTKYGEENFQFIVLERCHPNKCLVREQYWIDNYEVTNPSKGYNICPVAGSALGVKRSEETKAKVGAASKARMTPEMRERLAAANRGKKYSAEIRAKVAEAGRGRKQSSETIEKSASKRRGRKRSVKTKVNIAMAALMKWYKADDITRKKWLDKLNPSGS